MEDNVGRLQITVADIRGHLFPLDVEHSCSVELLYEEVANRLERPRNSIRLFYSGEHLLGQHEELRHKGLKIADELPPTGIIQGSVVHVHVSRGSRTPLAEDFGVTRVLQTSPSHSRTTGGVLVHVYGRNFLDTQSLSVRFGAVVTPGSFKSHQLLTCIAPAHPPGVVSVEVSTNGHQFTEGSEALFTYIDDRVEDGLAGLACPVSDGSLCDTAIRTKEMEAIAIRNRTGM